VSYVRINVPRLQEVSGSILDTLPVPTPIPIVILSPLSIMANTLKGAILGSLNYVLSILEGRVSVNKTSPTAMGRLRCAFCFQVLLCEVQHFPT
jgi:hypothetical protein